MKLLHLGDKYSTVEFWYNTFELEPNKNEMKFMDYS